MNSGYKFLEHTADIRLSVRGKTKEELFQNAALGMMEFLFEKEAQKSKPTEIRNIKLSAPDEESLLVDWLSELLIISNSEYKIALTFEFAELNERILNSNVGLAPATAKEDIKAVTYHGLKIEKSAGLYHAKIVFDI